MSSKAMSLKGRIKNYAKSNNIAAQVVLQNYMFERFLERLSVSEYNEKFVVKGGMLILRRSMIVKMKNISSVLAVQITCFVVY